MGPPAAMTPESEAAELAWLDRAHQRLGRPLRVLHIGNTANNAFNNARIQRSHRIEADVLCADNYHIMATPEWEEAQFDAAPEDAFFPDWSTINLHGYQRPRWFAAAPLQDACRYLEARASGTATEADRLWHRMEHERHVRCSKSQIAKLGLLRRKIGWKLRHEQQELINNLGILADRHERAASAIGARSRADLIALWQSRHNKKPFPALATDLDRYWQQYKSIHRLLGHYDIIQGYAQDGIWALLAGKPYAAYEHGTLRQLPFEDNVVGRIVAMVYGLADRVFVTNIDCLASADRLDLDTSRVTPLPHAFDDAKLRHFRADNCALVPACGPLRLFMPARQDWQDGDPNLAKGNDLFFRACSLLVKGGTPLSITAVNWGRDLEASKALIDELGLTNQVTWVGPMQKTELWHAYLTHHAVIDQFRLAAFGGVTFEALALGRRVITALDETAALRFFGEAPPLFAANDTRTIAAALAKIAADPDDTALMGAKAAIWIERHHSARRVTALQAAAYRKMLDDTSHPV